MIRLLTISAVLLASGALADDSAERYPALDRAGFEAAVEGNSKVFAKFFAPWCGHCKRLAPAWDELSEHAEGVADAAVVRVDCTEEKELCQEHGVRGYPTLKMFQNGKAGEPFRGARDLNTLKEYLADPSKEPQRQKPSGGKKEATGEPDARASTADQFRAAVDSGDHVFVKFFAPWCGHCKKLAPTWTELMDETAEREGKQVLKVDCTREGALCKEFGVKGYPTLKMFNAREGDPIAYRGGRDKAALLKFLDDPSDANAAPAKQDKKKKPAADAAPLHTDSISIAALKELTADEGNTVFTKFYAPWCGHCKRLAPTHSQLKDEFASQDNVHITSVDCTLDENDCKEFGVRGFPTLLKWKAGEQSDPYRGARTLEALRDFVSE